MAAVYSRSAMLIQSLVEGTYGYGNSALTATVVQAIVGTNGAALPGTTGVTSEGVLTDVAFINTNSAVTYVQVFDVAAVGSVTLGSTTPTYTYTLPGTSTGVFQVPATTTFANGLALAATTTSTGSTAAVSTVSVGLAYL